MHRVAVCRLFEDAVCTEIWGVHLLRHLPVHRCHFHLFPGARDSRPANRGGLASAALHMNTAEDIASVAGAHVGGTATLTW